MPESTLPPDIAHDPASETLDSVLAGRVRLIQPKNGYRLSVDAVLLAHFARDLANSRCVDAGCGCGVIGLALVTLASPGELLAVEVQAELAELSRRNAALNGATDIMTVHTADIRSFARENQSTQAQLVVANPPFFALGDGRDNPNRQVAVARREHIGTLSEWVTALRLLLDRKGRLAVIYPVARLADLMAALKAAGLGAQRMRFVHGRLGYPAKLFLLEAAVGKGGALTVEAPLVMETPDGSYTPEAEAILNGNW